MFGVRGESGFEGVGVEVDFAGGDLFGCCSVEAEVANAEGFFGAERRAEDAAGHGASRVEVAESGGRIEGGAGFVVGEVFKVNGTIFVEKAGAGVAGKIGSEAVDGLAGAEAEGGGAFGIGGIEERKAFAEADGVELGDGEDADAALGASGSTQEPGAGAAGSVGDGGVDDLNELRIACGEWHGVRIEEAGVKNCSLGRGMLRGSERRAESWCKTSERRG